MLSSSKYNFVKYITALGITLQAVSNSLFIAGVITDAIARLHVPYFYVHFFQIVTHNLRFMFMQKVHSPSTISSDSHGSNSLRESALNL